MYLLKLALRPWRVAPVSQVSSGVAVGVLLVIAGFLAWMERGLAPVVARLESEQVITAYLDPSVDAKDENALTDRIRVGVGAKSVEVKLVSSRDFVGEIKKHYPDLGRELEDLGHEMTAVVPRYVSLAGALPPDAADKVRAVAGVESVESSRDRYVHVVGAFRAIRWVSRLLALGLALALLTGLVHLSKMNAYLHRDAVQLLRLWGGGAWALRAPGLLSGLAVGLLGGALAALAWLQGVGWLAGQVRALSPMLAEIALPGAATAAVLLLAGALMGLVAGALGRAHQSA